jgi:hypothetical protein
MFCPYCQTWYTVQQPCFCQPPLTPGVAEPEKVLMLSAQSVSEERVIPWNASNGNRTD